MCEEYFKISFIEYYNLRDSSKLEFENSEVEYIRKYAQNIEISEMAIIIKNNGFIIKLPDEWYLFVSNVVKDLTHYKCDQMDGLIKCLNDHLL